MKLDQESRSTHCRGLVLLLLLVALPVLQPAGVRAQDEVTFITVDQNDDDTTRADDELRTYLEQGLDLPGRKFKRSPYTYEEVGRILVRWNSEGLDGPYVARVTPYVYVAAEMLGADLEVLGTYESTATDSNALRSSVLKPVPRATVVSSCANGRPVRLARVLIDSRHPPQKLDMDFLFWLGENHIPLAIVLTKSDKISN